MHSAKARWRARSTTRASATTRGGWRPSCWRSTTSRAAGWSTPSTASAACRAPARSMPRPGRPSRPRSRAPCPATGRGGGNGRSWRTLLLLLDVLGVLAQPRAVLHQLELGRARLLHQRVVAVAGLLADEEHDLFLLLGLGHG